MSGLYYGVAYYDEYIREARLDKDIEMMLAAGINVVRIAESTWSTLEPSEGQYNFHHIDRVLDAMHHAGIAVIIGTPTYAIPHWLAKQNPDILVTTPNGHEIYGRRQIIDIMNPYFLTYAENIIRVLLEHVCHHPAIIGYQVDNETKHYENVGEVIQTAFKRSLKKRFPDIRQLNDAFGLEYWSNRIDCWDDFPPVEGTINASLGCAFARFRREKVADYLAWQAAIVTEYAQPSQFVTQNFDFEWRGWSFGLQPRVDHFAAAQAMSVASVDVYHPTQDHLTGREIAFSGDVARNLKGGKNYFVMETQAQGFAKWTPYPGQLRLQAFSHIASGASMVSYWHWHSIHNSYETYWKGLLSHDFAPGPTYQEAVTIGTDMARLSGTLNELRVENDVAILVSNNAMEAMNWFRPDTPQPELNNHGHYIYNDILRRFWDALYDRNVGVDIINGIDPKACKYRLIVIPALYSASNEELERINQYVENGGRVLIGFKSGFCDEDVKVRTETQPGVISKCCGVSYSQFTIPENVGLKAETETVSCLPNESAEMWMELLSPASERTTVLLRYDHPHWGKYAAATISQYGRGQALYVGFLPSQEQIFSLFSSLATGLTLTSVTANCRWPVVVRHAVNKNGESIQFIFNYSAATETIALDADVHEPLSGDRLRKGDRVTIAAWGMRLFVKNV
ncbi:beta-galactosidase [Pectobacterium araliae]|uniref:Beta-galactosidase n=1 Tax=Pectobacterium araliae TaxID=3073862 RepID=A0AAN0KF64_9GAMM|nr:beta-galactosidase [Pectobacterium sp. MAFF 302110]GKW20226.1 beta-galactosidase [Pectobacterium carotovorum subsp. carotovorum]